jgi:hypothetical protein
LHNQSNPATAVTASVTATSLMENPYAPSTAVAQTSRRTWIHVGLAVVSGFLSLLLLVAIVGNVIIFAGLKTWPDKGWQWAGIVAMTIVMLISSIGFAHVSVGLIRSVTRLWKRGLWLVAASVIGYILIAAFAVMMRATA